MKNNRYFWGLIIGLWAVVMGACSPTDEPTPVEKKPLRMKIRNICGDETIYIL